MDGLRRDLPGNLAPGYESIYLCLYSISTVWERMPRYCDNGHSETLSVDGRDLRNGQMSGVEAP
jgi:hypothetical protein